MRRFATPLLIKCGVVLGLVFAAFILHSVIHIAPSVVALIGAGLLIAISGLERSDYLSGVGWETLLFFAGLFVMIGALVKTGTVDALARAATQATGGNALLTVMLGIARRAGTPISFWEFTRKGAVVTAMSVALSGVYLWLRYFVLG